MIKIFLIVMACQSPDFINCQDMQTLERPDPIQCQLDRIMVGAIWTDEIRDQGLPNWSVFTRCEIVKVETEGEKG